MTEDKDDKGQGGLSLDGGFIIREIYLFPQFFEKLQERG